VSPIMLILTAIAVFPSVQHLKNALYLFP
jgi:hypothetical protein